MEQQGSDSRRPAASVTPDTLVGTIMTRNVITSRPETSVAEVVQLMARHRITGLPVIDSDDRVVGGVCES
ncbi:MAG: CBS domain-containing protein, partial [Candidatus Dormibacteria bacterium]